MADNLDMGSTLTDFVLYKKVGKTIHIKAINYSYEYIKENEENVVKFCTVSFAHGLSMKLPNA